MSNIVAYSRNNKPHIVRQFKGEEKPFSIDLTKVEQDIGTVLSATWTVSSGSAVITDEALASSKATANIETNQEGRQLIRVLCESAGSAHIAYISIKVIDPDSTSKDY